MRSGKHLAVFLLVALFTSACGAQKDSISMGGESGIAPEAVIEFADSVDLESPNRFSLDSEVTAIEPLVIRNANLTLVVDDPGKTADEIGKMAEQFGGFVVYSNVFQSSSSTSSGSIIRASVSVRVPVERLDDALERIQNDAIEVREKRISGEDVTQQFTDLQSRLRNLEAAEEQLLVIMEAALETEDVLRVFNDLRQVREDIEVIKGQMNYFEDSARLSLINVELIPDELAQPLEIGGWRPEGTAKQAVETLIQTLQFLADAGIWLAICALPIALLVGVPGFFIGRSVLRRRKSQQDVVEGSSSQAE
jgi:hypothetical protein